ncbi:hypothetical protein CDAR_18221 [Caerostris darwini]|uniref:Uncharacterized protein n=1 Tax=Caerostris darwini TaxID=1538125 RepID=A0AAV4V945_9ARAC|nr:hypothetical protein CDAR_18221 [Caerostris darwini]
MQCGRKRGWPGKVAIQLGVPSCQSPVKDPGGWGIRKRVALNASQGNMINYGKRKLLPSSEANRSSASNMSSRRGLIRYIFTSDRCISVSSVSSHPLIVAKQEAISRERERGMPSP